MRTYLIIFLSPLLNQYLGFFKCGENLPVKQLMNLEPVDEEIAKWIVEEATKDNVTPEAVSQGMWYFGS